MSAVIAAVTGLARMDRRALLAFGAAGVALGVTGGLAGIDSRARAFETDLVAQALAGDPARLVVLNIGADALGLRARVRAAGATRAELSQPIALFGSGGFSALIAALDHARGARLVAVLDDAASVALEMTLAARRARLRHRARGGDRLIALAADL